MANIIPIIQIILSILLTVVILLQKSGGELGGAFGGSSQTIHTTKRGFDKTLFHATIVLAILFVISAIIAVLL